MRPPVDSLESKALPCRLAMPAYRDTQGEAGFPECYTHVTRTWHVTHQGY